ncbi:MAG: hypothetical protein NTZ75_08755 [Euryarchaeota archaeon]|nr:hypothetical protein [Euryarchaeota archaeon]
MKKQITAIFLMLVMIGTTFIIIPNEMKVQASTGGGSFALKIPYNIE